MTENITRCPQCHTSFRIPESILTSGKGSVRCGSCLHIFIAKDHLVKSETTANETADTNDDTDEILISDDMDRLDKTGPVQVSDEIFGSGFSEDFMRNKKVTKESVNLFERDSLGNDKDDENSDSDEAWALDLLESTDNEEAGEAKQEKGKQEKTKQDSGYSKAKFQFVESEEPDTSDYDSRETEELPGDKDIDDFSYESSFDNRAFANQRFEELEAETEVEEEAEEKNQYPDTKSFIHAIEPEPVEFAFRAKHHPFWYSKPLWGSLSVIAGLVFIGQLAWINFDTLSLIKPYRTYYSTACNVIGCTLPQLEDRQKIRAANLVVRSHPNKKNILIVDAVLQNMARFQQSFPALDLVFTDSQDRPVAARRVAPSEYLGGELAGYENMPLKQPVHISIEIVDPGKDAVGYRIGVAE